MPNCSSKWLCRVEFGSRIGAPLIFHLKMLIPSTRLLLWLAVLAFPCAVLGGTVPGAAGLAAGVIGLLVLMVLGDAWGALGRLAGIRVSLPELVRLQKDRPGHIEVRIENEQGRSLTLRLGLAFPGDTTSACAEWDAPLDGAAGAAFSWPCTLGRRGSYPLRWVYLEAPSALGFWAKRGIQMVPTILRVYPDLFEDRKKVAALFLKRGNHGVFAQRQVGQGREFEKLRDYVTGDSVDDVHWKASARRGYPVTKVFQVERTQEVYVILDCSRLTGRILDSASGASGPVLERFVSGAMLLGLAAQQQGDQFGLITFSDKVHGFIRAKSGQAHYDVCRDQIYALQPEPVTPDFEELFTMIRLKLRKRALLIFLTSLEDPMIAESFAKGLPLISGQHLVLVNMLNPVTAHPLFSQPLSGVDDIYSRLGGHLQWHQLAELQKVFQRRGVRLSLLDGERLAAELIAQHLHVKARQLL